MRQLKPGASATSEALALTFGGQRAARELGGEDRKGRRPSHGILVPQDPRLRTITAERSAQTGALYCYTR